MKLLVTGGCGFIGSHFVDYVVKMNHEVVVVDNLSSGSNKNLESANKSGKVQFHHVDITDYQKIEKLISDDLDGIIHFAALTGVLQSFDNPVEFANVNVLGTLNLLENCRKKHIPKFIFASTGAIYGNQKAPFDEEMLPDPISPYAASKIAAENYCISYGNTFDISYSILRFSNVFGPRKSFGPYANVIPKFVRSALRNEPITVFGDGTQERDFVFVKDVARACFLALSKENSGIFNIATGVNTSINNLIPIIESLMNRKFTTNYSPPRDGEIKYAYSSISKATQLLGYRPEYDLQKGLQEYIEYEKGLL
jgi:UDP-glucose 4-epimerase